MSRPRKPGGGCGTERAYWRHVKNHEPRDEACRAAHAAAQRARYVPVPPEIQAARRAAVREARAAGLAAGRAAVSEARDVRLENYIWLRSTGESRPLAAARAGLVSHGQTVPYEAAYQRHRLAVAA